MSCGSCGTDAPHGGEEKKCKACECPCDEHKEHAHDCAKCCDDKKGGGKDECQCK